MYQHDLPDAKLTKTRSAIVTECVCFVGKPKNLVNFLDITFTNSSSFTYLLGYLPTLLKNFY